MIVVIPLYCVAVMMAFLATRFGTTLVYGQSTGVYDHYFYTFLNPERSAVVVLHRRSSWPSVVMLVHTYYGYTATGGPAGVGEAVGRAVRTSLVAAVSSPCSSRWPSTASPATSISRVSADADHVSAATPHPPGLGGR